MLGLGHDAPPPNQPGRVPTRRGSKVRLAWALIALAWAACSDGDDDDEIEPPPTRVIVAPSAFLGGAACGDAPGAVRTYQATLIDVTDGYQEAFQLPSSEVTSCTQEVTFEFVQPGHRYIARVAAFDRTDLETLKPGLPLVVDPDGAVTGPTWSTTCFGYDDLDYSAVLSGLGGASQDDVGFGGYGAAFDDDLFGVMAYLNSAVVVRGCEDLGPVNADTGVSIDIQTALAGLACGTEEGQIERFSVFAAGSGGGDSGSGGSDTGGTGAASALGGLGGLGGSNTGGSNTGGTGGSGGGGSAQLAEAPCGELATILGLSPNLQHAFDVFAYEGGATDPTHQTECRAYTVLGVIVPASCDPLQPID